MRTILLPKDTFGDWDAVKILRRMVLTLPFWKQESNLDRIETCLEIDENLNNLQDGKFSISNEAWAFLKESMQLQGINPIPDSDLNRLYMLLFRAVVKADRS